MVQAELSPVFVVGCPRSGTTLLRNLLNSHPSLAIPWESHFITRLYRAAGNPGSPAEAVRLARVILSSWWIARWGLDLHPKAFADCESFAALVDRLFSTWAHAKDRPRWGDKTPQYALDVPALLEIFPRAKVLHIIRDGRDVALSWVPKNFGPGNVVSAAREWKRLVLAARGAARCLPGSSVLELRYESLLAEPETTMRSVCDFIGEPYHPAVCVPTLDFPPIRRRIFGTRTVGQSHQPRIVDGNSERWRSRLSVRDRERFEYLAGDLLDTLGYPVEGWRRPVSEVELAMWRTHDSVRWILDRLNTHDKLRWAATELVMRREQVRGALAGRGSARSGRSRPAADPVQPGPRPPPR